MATNDCDLLGGGISALDFANEAAGADNIESGDAKQALGVVDTLGLEDLGSDRDSRVNLERYVRYPGMR